jgi:hypothetical protein
MYIKGKENNLADGLSRLPIGVITFPQQISQSTDVWYNSIYKKCQDNPQQCRNFMIEDGNLYKLAKDRRYNIAGSSGSSWKRVIPSDHVMPLITSYHNDHCHPGTFKTVEFLCRYFYCKNLASYVKDFIAACEVCKAYKHSNRATHGLMRFPKQIDYPMQSLSMDLIGPLNLSLKGNMYILTVVDNFSKFV